MFDEAASVTQALIAWFHEDYPRDEYGTYMNNWEYLSYAPPLVVCIFLDLIDHSEAA